MAKIHSHALVESDTIGDGTSIWAFAHVMKGVCIGSDCNIGDHSFLESGAVVGNRVTIKNGVMIWEGIVVEDDVFIGPRATFTNDRYPRSPRMEEVAERYQSRDHWLCQTTARRGCSIGAGAIICPGVELGQYSVIGAGAVVTRNVAPFTLVTGNPARTVGTVCSCGQRLDGQWQAVSCEKCGETGFDRAEKLNQLVTSPPPIVSANQAD